MHSRRGQTVKLGVNGRNQFKAKGNAMAIQVYVKSGQVGGEVLIKKNYSVLKNILPILVI